MNDKGMWARSVSDESDKSYKSDRSDYIVRDSELPYHFLTKHFQKTA